MSFRVVQELLGHATITMTERYAHLAPELRHDAVAKLVANLRPIEPATLAMAGDKPALTLVK